MTNNVLTGGCQCGAIRFRVEGALTDASVCHCRMCQKAFGAFFAPLVNTKGATLTWTRGQPKHFASSNFVKRGFCENCGTPLSYEAPDGIALSIAAFDHPEKIPPTVQFGIEGKIPYVDGIPSLPSLDTMADSVAAPFLAQLVSFQHPDHDTETWPPQPRPLT
ncbi:MAG TPA: GFA family protein [Hyphomicrobium sp.]|nr:GFA family protein [Hyphomicrobium sp.]